MTSKTDFPPVLIGASSQQTVGAFLVWSAVNLVTREARDLTLEQGERGAGRARGNIINRMVIFFVVMTIKTRGRGIGARGKKRTTWLGPSGRMTLHANRM